MTLLPDYNFYSVVNDNEETVYGVGLVATFVPLVSTPYAIFTKYSGASASTLGANTNPLFTESEILTRVDATSTAFFKTSFPQHGHSNYKSHTDWLAMMYGINGFTTPDANNPGRQEFHRVDFLLQKSNTQWRGDFGIINGIFLDIPEMETQMQANVGSGVGGFYPPMNSPIPTNIDPNVTVGGSHLNSDNIWDSHNSNLMTWNQAYNLAAGGADNPSSTNPEYFFTYRIHFADNLIPPPVIATYSFTVCDNPSDPLYYLTTSQDCQLATIPAANLPGGLDHNVTTFIPNNSCCTAACTLETEINVGAVTGANCASFGINDGVIQVTTTNPAWTSTTTTGTPWTSGSQFEYRLTLSNGATVGAGIPQVGGGSASAISCVTNITSGTEHMVTCASTAFLVPYVQISGPGIPAGAYVGQILSGNAGSNVTKFTMVDILGNNVLATAAATISITYASGGNILYCKGHRFPWMCNGD